MRVYQGPFGPIHGRMVTYSASPNRPRCLRCFESSIKVSSRVVEHIRLLRGIGEIG